MINYGGGIPSVDGIAAAFPHKIHEKISGTPSRIDIDDAQGKPTENAVSRPSTRGGGAHGHSGMVVPTTRYIVEFSPTAYAVGENSTTHLAVGTTIPECQCAPPPLVEGRDAAFSVGFPCASSISIRLGVPLIFS